MFFEKSATHFENHLLLGKAQLISEKNSWSRVFPDKSATGIKLFPKTNVLIACLFFNEKIATHG
jgi:hypothetical protein